MTLSDFAEIVGMGFACGVVSWVTVYQLRVAWKSFSAPLDHDMRNDQ